MGVVACGPSLGPSAIAGIWTVFEFARVERSRCSSDSSAIREPQHPSMVFFLFPSVSKGQDTPEGAAAA
jgi:hypothetical protein